MRVPITQDTPLATLFPNKISNLQSDLNELWTRGAALKSFILDEPLLKAQKSFWAFLSKKLFLFSRYSNFCIFQPVSHCYITWSKINLKVYDIINCPDKNLIIHLVWYLEKEKSYDIQTLSIDRVLNKEHFYGKIMQKMYTKSHSQTPFLFW